MKLTKKQELAIEQLKIDSKKRSSARRIITPKIAKSVLKSIKIPIKRLYFDIETSPNIVYSWNVGYKLNINYDNIINERAIICICYKWEGESKVNYLSWDKGDDKKMIYDFYDILMKAEEIVGHNSDNFDVKWFKTRCLYHGITQMPDITSIDTLKISRRNFRFNSNRLDYIGKFLGLGQKTDTGGFSLWKEIMDNNQQSLTKMINYCKNDVVLLEKVYNKLSGYTKAKTHVGVLNGNSKCSCPKCSSESTWSKGIRVAASGTIKHRMICKVCRAQFSVSSAVYEARNK
jgi:DNA polymerase elongation subunit (family B)